MKSIVSLSFPLSERPSLSILQVFVDPQQIFKNSQHTLLSPSGFTTNRVLLSVSCFFALRAKKLNPINLLLVDRDIISVFSRVKLWPVYYNLFHCSRSVISTFSWGRQKKLNFSIPPDYWKIGKKQHFICSNLTLFIVPFFLAFFFSLFYLFFLFCLSFFLFFLFPWRQPPQMTPLHCSFVLHVQDVCTESKLIEIAFWM